MMICLEEKFDILKEQLMIQLIAELKNELVTKVKEEVKAFLTEQKEKI